MNTMKVKSLFLGLALALSTAIAGHAQSSEALAPTQNADAIKEAQPLAKPGLNPQLSPWSYSAYCAYRYNGSGVIINCSDSRINSNSRVVASISEYSTDPRYNRFIGAARMTVHNLSPYNGGFQAWTDVEWPWPLNVRVDFFVEP